MISTGLLAPQPHRLAGGRSERRIIRCQPHTSYETRGQKSAGREHPNVVVLDLMMPVPSGWDVQARDLEPDLKEIPVTCAARQRYPYRRARKAISSARKIPK